jgi:putative FmdB family regulatory protein
VRHAAAARLTGIPPSNKSSETTTAMPIYEYVCTTCDHRTDILHGINDPGPHFCPSCGKPGTMRKLFAPPAILYKGSGWAKKDRGGASRSAKGGGAAAPAEGKADKADQAGDSGAKPAGEAASSSSGAGGGTTTPTGD